ncbi:MAG: lysostaphin resistance A-like protein [Dermatophilaceae bacterium]
MLVPSLVAATVLVATGSGGDVLLAASAAGGSTVMQLLLLAPLIVLGLRGRIMADGRQHRRDLALFAGLLALYLFTLSLPRLPGTEETLFPWAVKLLNIFWALLLVFWWRRLRPAEVGLRWPTRADLRWGPVPTLLSVAIVALLASLTALSPGSPRDATLEAVLFQWTMPGFEEELVMRGVLLALLAGALGGRRWRLGGVSFGWDLVVVTLLFGALHGFTLISTDDGSLDLLVDPVMFIVTGLLGFWLGWIRLRADSLVPAMLAHNAVNGMSAIVAVLVS